MEQNSQFIISNSLLWAYHQEKMVHLFSQGNWLLSYTLPEEYQLTKAEKIKDEGNQAVIYYPNDEKRFLILEKSALIEQKAQNVHYTLQPMFSNSLIFRGDSPALEPLPPIKQLSKNCYTREGFPVVELNQTPTKIVIITKLANSKRGFVPLAYKEWQEQQPKVKSKNAFFNALYQKTLKSLYKLRLKTIDGEIKVAGLPDFPSLFGRDFSLSALAEIYLWPEKVKEELLIHLKHVGEKTDIIRNEQKGRAIHEYNYDAITIAGAYQQFPSYYANDSNALLLITIFRLAKIQRDFTIVEKYPAIITELFQHMLSLDVDGDGFIEYQQQAGQLLKHQTWRDGGDEIRSLEDRAVLQPIAPLHDQLCMLGAIKEIIAFQEQFKNAILGWKTKELRRQFQKLKKALNESFWMSEYEGYALALDGNNEQVKVVNSDVCLGYYFQLFDEKKAHLQYHALVDKERLLAKEGIRTVSKEHLLYSPRKYQRGGVWPWQLAVLIPGLRNYSLDNEPFLRCLDYLVTGDSLAEVYIPDRDVLTPLSNCIEQRWSAAIPWLALLEGFCGLKVGYNSIELKPRKNASNYYPLSIRGIFVYSKKHDLLLETTESAKIIQRQTP
ncbi:MAG: amylo-alpha-1,6-glucosidase [Candidatus Heimdallarchaeota archaeon]